MNSIINIQVVQKLLIVLFILSLLGCAHTATPTPEEIETKFHNLKLIVPLEVLVGDSSKFPNPHYYSYKIGKEWYTISLPDQILYRHKIMGTSSFLQVLSTFSKVKIPRIFHLEFANEGINLLFMPLGGFPNRFSVPTVENLQHYVDKEVKISELSPKDASQIQGIDKFYIIHSYCQASSVKTKWAIRRCTRFSLSFHCINFTSFNSLSTNWCDQTYEGGIWPDDRTNDASAYVIENPWDRVPQFKLSF